MAHLVRHRTPAGESVISEVADLDAAVALVERLRNDEHAEDVRVFAEVPLRFETYVKVSVAAVQDPAPDVAATTSEEPVTEVSPAADTPPAAVAPPAEPVPPPPGVLAPVRVEAPSADAEELVHASPAESRRGGLFHR